VVEETAKDTRTCHVQIYHDAKHASTIRSRYASAARLRLTGFAALQDFR
jgi:hypothetical protein